MPNKRGIDEMITQIDTPAKADALVSGLCLAMTARMQSELAARKMVLKTIYRNYFDGNDTFATSYSRTDAINQIINDDRDDSDGEGAYEVKKGYDGITDVITIRFDGSVTEERIDLSGEAQDEVRRLNREFEQEQRDEAAHIRSFGGWR